VNAAAEEIAAAEENIHLMNGTVVNDDIESSYCEFRNLILQLYPEISI
jgi:hypothetical protein